MSVKVSVGEVYNCGEMKRGESTKGEWAVFPVKAAKGYDNIKVWATNPQDIKGAQAVRIVKIDRVDLKSRLDEKSQKWFKEYAVTATLEKALANGGDFMPGNLDDLNSIFGI